MFTKYLSPAYATRFFYLSVDLVLSIVSFHLANLLRHNFDFKHSIEIISISTGAIILVRLAFFLLFNTYSVIIRYTGEEDVKKVVYAICVGSIVLFTSQWFGLSIDMGLYTPLSVLMIDFFLLVFFLVSFRLMMRLIHEAVNNSNESRINTIIFGAGESGITTLRVLLKSKNQPLKVVAVLDDNLNVNNKYLDGIKIHHTSAFSELVKNHDIKRAIIAIQKLPLKRKNEFVDMCLKHDVSVMQVPSAKQWINGNLEMSQIKNVKIEDLLNRPPITLNKDNIKNQIKDQHILITGGAGSIGSELVRQVIKFHPKKLIIVDQAETPLVDLELEIREKYRFENIEAIIGDVRNRDRMEYIFREYRPQVIFHAAAYKHVPIMEHHPSEAVCVNVEGTKNIADLAVDYDVSKFVMVSTDKAVNPTNIMGASKRIAEIYIQSLNNHCTTQFITTRFGNVLGSNGSVIPRFRKQIEAGGPVTVTHPEITRYFMTIPEASQLVLEAGAMGKGGEIFLFDMGKSVKILDLAEKLIRLAGFKPYDEIDIQFIGLRPGEKLKEELLSNKENSIPTHHNKITKARTRDFDFEQIDFAVKNVIQQAKEGESMPLVIKMKQIIPEFISNNSVFQAIDKNIKDPV